MATSTALKIVDGLYASAGLATALITIPQVIKIWITHTQHINGMSLLTWAGYLLFAVIGLLYGILRKQPAMVMGYGCCASIYTAVVIGLALQTSSFW